MKKIALLIVVAAVAVVVLAELFLPSFAARTIQEGLAASTEATSLPLTLRLHLRSKCSAAISMS